MIVTDLKSLAQVRAFNNIGGLACNANGYPFVTLLSTEKGKDTKANNVYFANSPKKDANGVAIPNSGFADEIVTLFSLTAGQKSTATALELIDFLLEQGCTVAQTTNAKGEIRYKLARKGSSKYLSESVFAEKFGLEITEEAMDFDVVAFKKEFRSKSEANSSMLTATVSSTRQEELELAEERIAELEELLENAKTPGKKARLEKEIEEIQAKYPEIVF